MKKLIILFISITLLYSCSANISSENTLTKSNLVGVWNLTSFKMEDTLLEVTQPGNITLSATAVGKNLNAKITFSENPDVAKIEGDLDVELTYEFGGTQVEDFNLDESLFTDIFGGTTTSWTLENNTLTFNGSNSNSIDVNVLEFSSNKIVLSTSITKTTITIGSSSSEVSGTALMTFEK